MAKMRDICDICSNPAVWAGEGMRFCKMHSPIKTEDIEDSITNNRVERFAYTNTYANLAIGLSLYFAKNNVLPEYAAGLRVIADAIEKSFVDFELVEDDPVERNVRLIKWIRKDKAHAPPEIDKKYLDYGLPKIEMSPFSVAPVMQLQEVVQKSGLDLPTYHYRKSGPDHEPVFECVVKMGYPINMEFFDRAGSKKLAKSHAAEKALSYLRKSQLEAQS